MDSGLAIIVNYNSIICDNVVINTYYVIRLRLFGEIFTIKKNDNRFQTLSSLFVGNLFVI